MHETDLKKWSLIVLITHHVHLTNNMVRFSEISEKVKFNFPKQKIMFRKALIAFSLMLVSGVLFYDSAYTHSGRTDANGGHYNRKTGTYHYHNSGRPPTIPRTDGGANAGTGTSLMSYPSEVFFGDTAYQVTRIIDGDTVEIRYDSKLTSVVLIGVDTPETVHPQKAVEAFGKEATAFTRNLLLGESVYLRTMAHKHRTLAEGFGVLGVLDSNRSSLKKCRARRLSILHGRGRSIIVAVVGI